MGHRERAAFPPAQALLSLVVVEPRDAEGSGGTTAGWAGGSIEATTVFVRSAARGEEAGPSGVAGGGAGAGCPMTVATPARGASGGAPGSRGT